MKKTLLAILMCAGAASATVTTVLDLSKDIKASDNKGILYDSKTGIFTDDTAVSGTPLTYKGGGDKTQTNTTFTLNLTDLSAYFDVTENASKSITLVNVDMGTDVSLKAEKGGLGVYQGGTSKNTTESSLTSLLSYTTLLADTSVFTGSDKDKYITLTFGQYQNGARVYSSKAKLQQVSLDTTSVHSTFTGLYVNSSYMKAVEFSNDWPTNGEDANFQALATSLNNQVKPLLTASVPEPTTATLSLLALAGLAARRRRK